jgi:DNA polymerase-3 subunit gamma/tau
MVGQEHVIQPLSNALSRKRLHHAYLFTGTRGVGKTTIARILAKCLNCETGITATPCGVCSTCQEIDAGRFMDLIEVDAASRTKVEDTRELLDNVQYAPSRGRFKIYLIDEVHMLSGHSFNALLKTLEEPPEHVKFLLATTDPQKLPMTVLSRCLQFNLKNLSSERIASYLEHVLTEEKISFEAGALPLLAQAANGSVRDSLSLLDQAIAYSPGEIKTDNMHEMLGTLEQKHVEKLLRALAQEDAHLLLATVNELAEFNVDFGYALEELLSLLHYIAIAHLAPTALPTTLDHHAFILELQQKISPEDVQLYYQIGVHGRRDLDILQNKKTAFIMVLLRMLAFRPFDAPEIPSSQNTVRVTPATTTQKSPAPASTSVSSHPKATLNTNANALDWEKLLGSLAITGITQALAANCALKTFDGYLLTLSLSPKHAALLNDKTRARLNDALNQSLGRAVKVIINVEAPAVETPADRQLREANEQHKTAIHAIENDPIVQSLVNQLGATLEPSLIKPKNDGSSKS